MTDTPLSMASDAQLRTALSTFLTEFTRPAFGAVPKREIELQVFHLMHEIGMIAPDASIYDVMTQLKVTRAKASQLRFDMEMRRIGDDKVALNDLVKEALSTTRFSKDGSYFVLEIENALVIAHLKEIVRTVGHISDTSFNPALVRLSHDAMIAVIEHLLTHDEQKIVQQALIQAGAPDTRLSGILTSAVTHLAQKAAGQAVGTALDHALKPLFDAAGTAITQTWAEIIPSRDGPPAP